MKKRILIVSDPPAAPGYLPRLRFLCDYLVEQGHEVTLLTEEHEPLRFAHTYPIVTIPMYGGSTFGWAIKTLWTLISDWHNRVFAQRALRRLSSDTAQPFDIVLCSAFSDFPLGAAQRIAARYRIPFVCDIRDLEEQVDDSRYQYHHQQWWAMAFRGIYRRIHNRRRNRVLRLADAVTTVSGWHADFIRTITGNRAPISVIYNGFDANQFYPEDIPAKTFKIMYIGSLYNWQKPAIEQVRRIVARLKMPHLSLELHTPDSDPVPHDRLGDAIRQSAVMLVLTGTRTHGMLTTKFFEALGCAKPVLCVPSDRGALAELIDSLHAGIATEDPMQIEAFITRLYSEWETNGFTRQDQSPEAQQHFSRQYQSALMEEIIINTVNTHANRK